MMRFVSGIAAALACFTTSALGAGEPTPRTFASNGLLIQVNRAVPPSETTNGDIVVSLVFTNTRDVPLDLISVYGGVQGITEAGRSYTQHNIAGIPSCTNRNVKADCLDLIEKGAWLPLSIDAKQSASITLNLFGEGRKGKACSLDLSIPVVVREPSVGRAAATWRQIAVGLPNIRMC